MGRSKKTTQPSGGGGGGAGGGAGGKAFCYWCDKEFAGEEVLIQHQIAKHFRCPHCKSGNAGKCINLECLIIHFRKIHRAELLSVPNAREGRNDPMESQSIYGMASVPAEVLEEWNIAPPPPEDAAAPVAAAAPVPEAPTFNENTGKWDVPQPAQLPPLPMPGVSMPFQLQPSVPTPSGGEEESAGMDWAAQAKAWMDKQKAEEPPPPVFEPPAPAPSPEERPRKHGFDNGFSGNNFSSNNFSSPNLQPGAPFQGFSLGSQQRGSNVDAGAAANKIAEFMETANLSVASQSEAKKDPWIISYDTVKQSVAAPSAAAPPYKRSRSRSRSRSRRRNRSRDRRSRSYDRRGRSRSRRREDRPRNPGPTWKPPPMESQGGGGGGKGGGGKGGGGKGGGDGRTIQIIEGAVRSRLQLKGEMEKFGRVETVYMGNRHDPSAEPPLVKFEQIASAEAALNAINTGQVFFDGMPVKAQMKEGGRRAVTRDIEREVDSNLHVTSRDLARDDNRRRDRYDDRRGGYDNRGRW